MAAPLLVAYGAHAVSGFAHGLVDQAFSTALEPATRGTRYDSNARYPNIRLTTDQLIDLYYRGGIGWTALCDELALQGVALLRPRGFFTGFGEADWLKLRDHWQAMVKARKPPLPLELLIQLHQLGRLDLPRLGRTYFDDSLHLYGYGESEKQLLLNKPYIFSPDEARIIIALDSNERPDRMATRANEEKYFARLNAAGMPDQRDQADFERLVKSVTDDEALELARRDLLLPDLPGQEPSTDAEREQEFRRLMIQDGHTDPRTIGYLKALQQRIPTEGELIEAAVKNAFVGPLSRILRLDDEYHEQPQFIVGTDRLGLSGSPYISLADMKRHLQNHKLKAGNEIHGRVLAEDESPDQADERALEYYEAQDKSLLTWAQVFWRSHWVNLSPSQIYTCLHRQRPVDTTKPGGAAKQAEYEQQLELLAIDPDQNTPENRYAIAVAYAKQYGRNPDVPPVTQDIVDTVLRANDYAPLFRGNLSAISYNVLRLVDIRRIVQLSLKDPVFARSAIHFDARVGDALPAIGNGGIEPTEDNPNPAEPNSREKFVFAWARENFLDRGQTPDAAQALATLATAQGQTTNRLQMRRVTRAYERAFRVGLIDEARLSILLRTPLQNLERRWPWEIDEAEDIFEAADMAADLYDDSGATAFLTEQDTLSAAEDLIDGETSSGDQD